MNLKDTAIRQAAKAIRDYCKSNQECAACTFCGADGQCSLGSKADNDDFLYPAIWSLPKTWTDAEIILADGLYKRFSMNALLTHRPHESAVDMLTPDGAELLSLHALLFPSITKHGGRATLSEILEEKDS